MLVHNHTQNPIGFSVLGADNNLEHIMVPSRSTANIESALWDKARELDIIKSWLDNGFLSDAKKEADVKKEYKKKIKPKPNTAKIPSGVTVERETVVAAKEQNDD